MSERITPEGIEAAFIESWAGWDEMEVMSIMFYGAKFKEGLGFPTDKLYTVCLDLNKGILEVYGDDESEGDAVIMSRKVTLNILPA